jgi:hypothetical protein
VIGTYVLKQTTRFVCGITSFELSAGSMVRVTQLDTYNSKVLIEFDDRLVDWFHSSTITKNFYRGS